MNETPSKPGTRLGRAIAYAMLYVIGLLALYGAGMLIVAIVHMLDLPLPFNQFGGMLSAALLLAIAWRQAGEGGAHNG